jgi:hypothetical protein
MFEYIKRVSIALSFITERIDENEAQLRSILKDSSLNLILLSQKFRHESYNVHDLKNLQNEIYKTIDLIDFARLNGLVSPMNGQVFLDSQIAFLKHIFNLVAQKNSQVAVFTDLKSLDESLSRKMGREQAMSKHFGENILSDVEFIKTPEENISDKISYENLNGKSESKLEHKTESDSESKIVAKKIVEEKIITPDKSSDVPLRDFYSNGHQLTGTELDIRNRRNRILNSLIAGGGSIKEICDKLSDLNEKTVQRDLLELMKAKKVIMLGKKRWAKYYLK